MGWESSLRVRERQIPGGAGWRSRRRRAKRVKRFAKKGVFLALGVGIAALAVSAGAVASTKKKSANVQVCVLLPDTQSSVRWTQFDPKYIGKALTKAGVTYSMNNALNDPAKQ